MPQTEGILEPLDELLLPLLSLGERRELDRIVIEDRRLDQLRLDQVAEGVVDELRPRLVLARVHLPVGEPAPQVVGVAGQDPLLLERLDQLDPAPGRLQVDGLAPEGRLRRPGCLARHGGDELLDANHRVLVVRVRLVPLEHRELGLVLVGDALVAEVLADLVHLLEPADDQPLEVELVGDSQIKVCVELVGVRDERLGEGAAVARLQNRCLDLDEAVGIEIRTDGRDDSRADDEVPPRFPVDKQVEVALPVAGLGLDSSRGRCPGAGGRSSARAAALDREGRLASLRPSRDAHHAHDVAGVRVHLAHPVGRAEELDLAGAVDEVEEDELPVAAPPHDAPREPAVTSFGALLETAPPRFGQGDLVPVRKAMREVHRRPRVWGGAAKIVRILVVLRNSVPTASVSVR